MGPLQAAIRESINLSKINQVVHEKNEPMGTFLERLVNDYHTYTPLDSEVP